MGEEAIPTLNRATNAWSQLTNGATVQLAHSFSNASDVPPQRTREKPPNISVLLSPSPARLEPSPSIPTPEVTLPHSVQRVASAIENKPSVPKFPKGYKHPDPPPPIKIPSGVKALIKCSNEMDLMAAYEVLTLNPTLNLNLTLNLTLTL